MRSAHSWAGGQLEVLGDICVYTGKQAKKPTYCCCVNIEAVRLIIIYNVHTPGRVLVFCGLRR